MSEIVYRVQRMDDGRGPYRPGWSSAWVEERGDLANLPPWQDEFGWGLLAVAESARLRVFGVGCRTLDQLRRWFTPGEFATLREHGYRAVRMEVDQVLAESEVQVVFCRRLPLRRNVQVVELYPVEEAAA